MKHLLLILPSLDAGGAENYALRLLRYLRNKYQCTVVSVGKGRGDLCNEFQEVGARILYKNSGCVNIPALIFWIRLFKNNNFDILCNLNGNFSGLSIMLASFFRIPKRIAFYRRSTNAFQPSRLKLLCNSILNRLVWKFATDILSNSNFALTNFFPYRKSVDRRFKVIPNAVDYCLFIKPCRDRAEFRKKLGISESAIVIGHVGRVDSSKNHRTIFCIAQQLNAMHSNLIWLYCGKGTDTEGFKCEIKKNSLETTSALLGLQKDMALVYSVIDIFLFPSLTEGQPNALIEAMLAGLPVLASDIEPVKEAVPEAFLKNLTNPNDVKMFASRISEIVENPKKAEQYILKNFAREFFDLEKRFEQFRQIMESGVK